MDLELAGHVAVVTGGANGIGAAVVERFRVEGARVAIWDRAVPTEGWKTAGVYQVPCDIVASESVAAALERTEAALGPIQHLVHAAAIGSGKFGFPFTEVRPEDWRRVVEVNILGTAIIADVVVARLIQQRQGTAVLIASVAGQMGSQTDPPYSASKAANINFAQCLAKDAAGAGVRVNTVCPGMVVSDLNRSVWQAWADRQPPDTWQSYADWGREKIRKLVPLGDWQTADDVADMVVFLSSARSRQVTGQTINVDGGFVMHW